MLSVIDIGNTNIVLGLFKGKEIIESWRMHTSAQRTTDEYGTQMLSFLNHKRIPSESIKGVIISSVVPPVTGELEVMCKRYFQIKALIVGPGLKTGMPILYGNPLEVGADRIVNAVAAYESHKKAGIVVDFGTATTFDGISPKGEYLGGAIAPGIGIGAEALFRSASKLPRVKVERPPSVIGRNTVQSIQAGLFFGYVGLVDKIVSQMKEEIADDCFVIATGGLAPLIASESKMIETVESNLTLEGLFLIYGRNKRATSTVRGTP